MAIGDHSYYHELGYEAAKKDLLMLLGKRTAHHAHPYVGTYECHPCTAETLAIVLAWLGVDTDLNPIVQAN